MQCQWNEVVAANKGSEVKENYKIMSIPQSLVIDSNLKGINKTLTSFQAVYQGVTLNLTTLIGEYYYLWKPYHKAQKHSYQASIPDLTTKPVL